MILPEKEDSSSHRAKSKRQHDCSASDEAISWDGTVMGLGTSQRYLSILQSACHSSSKTSMGFPKPAHAFAFLCSYEQLVPVHNSMLPPGYDLLVDKNRCQVRLSSGHDCQAAEFQGGGSFISMTLCSFVCSMDQVLASGIEASLCLKWKSSKADKFPLSNGSEKGHPCCRPGWCH